MSFATTPCVPLPTGDWRPGGQGITVHEDPRVACRRWHKEAVDQNEVTHLTWNGAPVEDRTDSGALVEFEWNRIFVRVVR